jgi:hypothetical protein
LTRYLRETVRKKYPRKNVKMNATEAKSHVYISYDPISSAKSQKVRKTSLILSKKEISRPQTFKKLIVQKNAHNEKMTEIIHMQKLKEVEFEESHHCLDLVTSILMRI